MCAGSFPERLALLRAVDPAEANAFRVLVVQAFEGVAVEDGDDLAEEVGGKNRGSRAGADQETSAAKARFAALITSLRVAHLLCGASLPVTPAARLRVFLPP